MTLGEIAAVCIAPLLLFALGLYRSQACLTTKALLIACRKVVSLEQENSRLKASLAAVPLQVKPLGGGAYSTNRDCSADEFVAAVKKHRANERMEN